MPRDCSRLAVCLAVCPAVCLAVLSTAAAVRAAPPQAPPPRVDVDPMRAPVGPPPAFRSPLSDGEYAKRYAAAVADLGPAAAAADAPTVGVTVTAVDAGSIGEKARLHVNDTIVTVDGHRLDHGMADLERLRTGAAGPQRLGVLRAGKPRDLTVPPGPLGVQVSGVWLLEAQYAHDLPPGTAASEQVRVAIHCCTTDPPLAEAALAHAAGPAAAGPMLDVLAGTAAAADGRYEDALAFLTAAREQLPAELKPRVDGQIVPLAVATFRWPLAKERGDADPVVLAGIAAYEARPHTVAEPDPVAVGHWHPQQKELVNLSPNDDGERHMAQAYADDLRDHGKTSFDSPDATFAQAQFGPLAANVDCWARMHFKFKPTRQHTWGKSVRLGLWDKYRQAINLDLLPGDIGEISYDQHVVVRLNLAHLVGDDRPFTIRLTAVGDRIEYVIDGQRIFYGPLPPDLADEANRKLPSIAWVWVGVKGDLQDFRYRTQPPRG